MNEPEKQVIAAIGVQGLTLKRYNRLAELAADYQSIRAKVTELVVENQELES